jgi:hypothetical protein
MKMKTAAGVICPAAFTRVVALEQPLIARWLRIVNVSYLQTKDSRQGRARARLRVRRRW